MKRIIAGEDEKVAAWVEARIPMMDLGEAPYSALGLLDRRGYITAGVIFNNFTRTDVHSHIATLGVRSLNAHFLRECFRYIFDQLGCARCTVMVASSNERSITFVQKLGYVHEGTLRESFVNGDDAHVFGMLRRECRWLRSSHGQSRANTATDTTTSTRRGRSTLPIGGPAAHADARPAAPDAGPEPDPRRGRSTLPIGGRVRSGATAAGPDVRAGPGGDAS